MDVSSTEAYRMSAHDDRPVVRIVSLHDPHQEVEDRAFWRSKSHEERLEALEILRRIGLKFLPSTHPDANLPRLRRVLRITQQQ